MVGASGVDLFISSDMFYLEIILEPSGAVKDVKIHHEGKVISSVCEWRSSLFYNICYFFAE